MTFTRTFSKILILFTFLSAIPFLMLDCFAADDTLPIYTSSNGLWNYQILDDGTANIYCGISKTAYLGNASDVDIPSRIDGYTVTSIDVDAFISHNNLKSVTIPDTVTLIHSKAFRNCNALSDVTIIYNRQINLSELDFLPITEIVLSSQITEINEKEFWNLTSLKNFEIPSTVASIGDLAFYGCTSLTSITIPNGVTSIGRSAFSNCTSLSSISLGQNLEEIESLAFYKTAYYNNESNWENGFLYIDNVLVACDNEQLPSNLTIKPGTRLMSNDIFASKSLTTVTIPASLKKIPARAFDNSDVQNVIIQEPSNLEIIGKSAFYSCKSLTEINIPDSVTCIEESAFRDCSSLSEVILPYGLMKLEYGSSCPFTIHYNPEAYYTVDHLDYLKIKKLILPEDMTVIKTGEFSNIHSIEELVLPDGLTTIEDCSLPTPGLADDSKRIKINIPFSVNYIGAQNKDSSYFYQAYDIHLEYNPDAYYDESIRRGIVSVNCPQGVVEIKDRAFYGCDRVESIIIADSVQSIGNNAFSWCTSLESLVIPDSVRSLGEINYVRSLKKLEIGDRIRSLYLDNETAWSIKRLKIGESCTYCSISFGVFLSLESIEVDANNKKYSSVDGVLFNKDQTELIRYPAQKMKTEYVIPNSVVSISKEAFRYCTLLESVTIPDSVTSIGSYAFSECTSLTSISIPDSVTNIPSATFSGCTSLESITIPDSVTSISEQAFSGCSSLTGITIPDSVTSVGSYAFSECTSLTSISIPDSVTNIPSATFSGCTSLESITIPDSVTSIGTSAFEGCTSLESITIPFSVTSIAGNAFNKCYIFTTIYGFDGSYAEQFADENWYEFVSLGQATCTSHKVSAAVKENEVSATCTDDGSYDMVTYCSVCGTEISRTRVTIPATGHMWATPHYEWSTDNDTCTAVVVCLNNHSHTMSETVDTSARTIESASCDSSGKIQYTAVFKNSLFIKQIKTVDVPALGHSWTTPTYTWSSDYSKCTATRVCSRDSSHKETETVNTTSKVTKQATTTSEGEITYTATFSNSAFATQTKKVATPKIEDNYKGFPDVAKGDWYYDAVKYCATRGFITGYKNGKFGPADALQRQDFVVILARIAGADLSSYTSCKLTDVDMNAYYGKAVAWAVDQKIIGGYDNGKFGVGDKITREQVATILYRYMDSPDVDTSVLNKFADKGSISSFAVNAIAWANTNGIINGKADGKLAPTATASRAEIATIIMRMDQQGMFT